MSARHAARRTGDLRRALTQLLGGSLLCGLMLAGLALPVVGTGGAAMKGLAAYWNSLPATLPPVPAAQGSVLLASDGRTQLATLFHYDRHVVPLEVVAPTMRQAVIAIEDSRFYTNPGVDLRGTARALVATASGGGVQGGSSITQQYVKNILLDQAGDGRARDAATGRSVARKLREARYALALGRSTSKDEVLAGYLNIAYFGAGAYGVEAAAERYFSTSAAKLNLAQSALLAGLVQDPNRLNPLDHPEAALRRRETVLTRMAQLGLISASARRVAERAPLALRTSYPEQGCSASSVPFYCDWVYAQLLADPALGRTTNERRRRLLEGGLRVVTGLSPTAQRAAQTAVDTTLPRQQRVAAVSVLVEPGTGLVRAMAVNRDYGLKPGQTVFPLASVRAFQPGSTFKTFALAAALEAGVPLDTRLPGGDRYTSAALNNPAAGYYVNAADGHGTDLTLEQATAESVNTAYVQLEERVGVLRVAEAARRAGVTLPTTGRLAVSPREGSLVLGTRETSVVELAATYAGFAAHGRICPAAAVARIVDASGHQLVAGPRGCHQAFTPPLADTVTSVLASVVAPGGTGSAAQLPGRPAAGKTGTTEDEATAWFVGYTPQLAGAVMLADPRGPQQHPLHDVAGVAHVYGGNIPAHIWRQVMTAALEGQPVAPLPPAHPAYMLVPVTPTLPALQGQPVVAALSRLAAMGLRVSTTAVSPPEATRRMVPPGTVLDTAPAAGSPAPRGLAVTVSVSR